MRPLLITVQSGPDKGRQISLGAEPLTIGRGAGERLQLSDGAVSRHHLSVQAEATGLRVLEIPGVNPVWTLEAGQRVALKPGQLLAPGAALTVGNSTLVIATSRPASETTSPPQAPTRAVELDATGVLSATPGASRLAALAALGDKLARCGSLPAVLRAATSWAVDALPAARALLLSPDGSDILSAASTGPLPDLALSPALLARVLRERRGVLLHDVLAEPDLADRRSVQMRGILGAMAAPVESLIFYVEWGPREALRCTYDDEALRLLVCAAQLIGAIGDSARERQQLSAAVRHGPAAAHGEMIGHSPAIQRLQVFLERVASTTSSVLLLGESGTGKELAAGMVHGLSPRASRPFVAINCAAIAESLLESELFGHEKGAFTGAVSQHDGVFARASTGTLFMDEVGELSPGAQARMLRVLENRTLTRVGGTREITVDVRLVAATHRDLRQLVSEGRFREDLLYRLSVIQTQLPPLRERRDDIPLLAQHFLRTIGERVARRVEQIAPAALEVLCRYRWPGNVRELRNVIERALVLGDGPVLEQDDLPPELLHAAPLGPTLTDANAVVRPLAELEREAIVAALSATGGNKARAAALLGIDRTTLYRKLKDYGIG
ncbi:sigma 54-interacting transcriptional regulator [Nannocystis sp.]|uniref:sigma 54-interacting transcriptional regulator n=1 Tax=Nannocystis sp. TaxID=1962667 RepID=UPI0025EDFBB9|nr:sigma 54-interacting transcriptional regulator [Nannocystis sp.]MBK7826732.1 sigma 54-interacting transcriptional regulator [Nannocystis sp.]